MKVLLATNSAATRSSYGIVSREVWTRVLRQCPNLDIVQHGWFHHKPIERVPWEIYPTKSPTVSPAADGTPPDLTDIYGEKSFKEIAAHVKPDIVWALGDPWMLETQSRLKTSLGYRYMMYCPVDSEPYHPRWANYMSMADQFVTITDYAQEVLKVMPGMADTPLVTIPHGVDTKVFQCADKATKQAYREEIGGVYLKDKFVLGWIGRDQFRKQVWQLYAIMYYINSGEWIKCNTCNRITPKEYDPNVRAPRDINRLRSFPRGYNYNHCWYCNGHDVVDGKPRDDIRLMTHMRDNPHQGYDLQHLGAIYNVGESILDATNIVDDTGIPTDAINYLYNCMDTFIFPTGGEGFGLPVLEAMACGVPVVYANYSGHTDFAEGLPVRVNLVPEIKSQRYRAQVDMGDMLTQIFRTVDDHSLRHQLKTRGLKTAEKMDWDMFTNKWIKLLEKTMETKTVVSMGEVI